MVASTSVASVSISSLPDAIKNGESLASLRRMVVGELEYTTIQQQPGKYLAVDCEMVGVGINGAESSLARVSLVNYHGAVIMDEFVLQRERVVDYRTEFSGIRPTDMINAKPFVEVQEKVAQLLKDRILVGHAVHNDLKALLLSHPRHQTRDTQLEAKKHKLTRSSRPALRHLVQQELNIVIQSGEHSSVRAVKHTLSLNLLLNPRFEQVTDARATMAVYRIHRKVWDKGHPPLSSTISSGKKRKRTPSSDHESGSEDEDRPASKTSSHNTKQFPGGGRKGVSSGLSTVTRHTGKSSIGHGSSNLETKNAWWKELGNGSSGSKGSLRMKFG
ncbi:unnamed protein product [Somion occarium]